MKNKTCGDCKSFPGMGYYCPIIGRFCDPNNEKPCEFFEKPSGRIATNGDVMNIAYWLAQDTHALAELFVLRQSLFYQITRSPEVLAPQFVYCEETLTDGDIWYSLLLGDVGYATKQEAIAATVEKLKEVEK